MSTKLKTGVRRARSFNSQWCVLQYVYLESPLCTNTCSICFHMDRMEALMFCSCLSLAFSPQHVSEKETNLTWVVAVMLATMTNLVAIFLLTDPQKVYLNKWTWWQTAKDSWGFVISIRLVLFKTFHQLSFVATKFQGFRVHSSTN